MSDITFSSIPEMVQSFESLIFLPIACLGVGRRPKFHLNLCSVILGFFVWSGEEDIKKFNLLPPTSL